MKNKKNNKGVPFDFAELLERVSPYRMKYIHFYPDTMEIREIYENDKGLSAYSSIKKGSDLYNKRVIYLFEKMWGYISKVCKIKENPKDFFSKNTFKSNKKSDVSLVGKISIKGVKSNDMDVLKYNCSKLFKVIMKDNESFFDSYNVKK